MKTLNRSVKRSINKTSKFIFTPFVSEVGTGITQTQVRLEKALRFRLSLKSNFTVTSEYFLVEVKWTQDMALQTYRRPQFVSCNLAPSQVKFVQSSPP